MVFGNFSKPELSLVELKVSKNGIFWAKNLIQKNFLGYFCQSSLKANGCQFQRPLMVGLIISETQQFFQTWILISWIFRHEC